MNTAIKRVRGYYVVHFLQMLTPAQKENGGGSYNQAIVNAKPFGGSKMHNKDFGGGIKFDYQIDAENALASVEGKTIHTCEGCGLKQVEDKNHLCQACTSKKADGTSHGEPCYTDTF